MTEPAGASTGFRILVVDDEDFSRKMLVRHLTALGADAITAVASDPQARDAMLRDPQISLVICDHYMQGGNGLRLLWDIRGGRLPVAHDLCFVLATSSKSSALAAVALALDADSFMTKPFSRDELARRLYVSLVQGDRDIREPGYYRAIEAPSMLAAAERADPKAPAKPGRPLVPLRKVRPDTKLGSDLVGADGNVLLLAGTVLTRHLLVRLGELGVEAVPI